MHLVTYEHRVRSSMLDNLDRGEMLLNSPSTPSKKQIGEKGTISLCTERSELVGSSNDDLMKVFQQ